MIVVTLYFKLFLYFISFILYYVAFFFYCRLLYFVTFPPLLCDLAAVTLQFPIGINKAPYQPITLFHLGKVNCYNNQ